PDATSTTTPPGPTAPPTPRICTTCADDTTNSKPTDSSPPATPPDEPASHRARRGAAGLTSSLRAASQPSQASCARLSDRDPAARPPTLARPGRFNYSCAHSTAHL